MAGSQGRKKLLNRGNGRGLEDNLHSVKSLYSAYYGGYRASDVDIQVLTTNDVCNLLAHRVAGGGQLVEFDVAHSYDCHSPVWGQIALFAMRKLGGDEAFVIVLEGELYCRLGGKECLDDYDAEFF